MNEEVLVLSPEHVQADGDWQADPEMLASIAEVGQLEPVLVRDLGNDKYRLVAGRRRLAACQELGLFVDALVLDKEDLEALWFDARVTLAENVHRRNPLSEGRALRDMKERGATDEEILRVSGLGKASQGARLKYLGLAPEFQTLMERGELPRSTAKQLCRLESHDDQRRAWEAAQKKSKKAKPPARTVDREIRNVVAEKNPVLPTPPPMTASGEAIDPVVVAALIRQLLVQVSGEHRLEALNKAIEILEGM